MFRIRALGLRDWAQSVWEGPYYFASNECEESGVYVDYGGVRLFSCGSFED